MFVLYNLHFSDPGYRIFYLLHQTRSAIWKAIEARLSEEHVTFSQWRILFILRHHNRLLTPAEICRCIFQESQTVTNTLTHLQKNGYVQKVDDPEDKRKVRIQITEKGEQFLKKHDQWMSHILDELIPRFSKEEFEQFEEYLKRSREWAVHILGIDLVEPIDEFCGTI